MDGLYWTIPLNRWFGGTPISGNVLKCLNQTIYWISRWLGTVSICLFPLLDWIPKGSILDTVLKPVLNLRQILYRGFHRSTRVQPSTSRDCSRPLQTKQPNMMQRSRQHLHRLWMIMVPEAKLFAEGTVINIILPFFGIPSLSDWPKNGKTMLINS